MNDAILLGEILQKASAYQAPALSKEATSVLHKFTDYSNFNKMLIYRQSGSSGRFVATKEKWKETFQRTIKLDASPILIVTKGYPIFVYDFADTEGAELPCAKELAPLLYPFQVAKGFDMFQYHKLLRKLRELSIPCAEKKMSYDKGGNISLVGPEDNRHYGILINHNYDHASKAVIVLHELAHIYLNTSFQTTHLESDPKSRPLKEIEAELICAVVCSKLGMDCEPSIRYLSTMLDTLPEKTVHLDNTRLLDIINKIYNLVQDIK